MTSKPTHQTSIQPASLCTTTLNAAQWGASVARILAAALHAVEPGAALRQWGKRTDHRLIVDGQGYDLRHYEHIQLIAIGKAATPMAQAMATLLGDTLTSGIIITKTDNQEYPPNLPPTIGYYPAGHPVPDERGVAASQRIADMLATTTERDLVIVLISGGGSALLTLPATGITLAMLQQTTSLLLGCGAPIHEVNGVRKHLDRMKGGGLAQQAAPAQVISLVLSDVVGNPLDVIASGPTTPDPTTFADVAHILARYQLTDRVPAAVRERVQAGQRGEVPDTPPHNDPIFARVQQVIIGSNEQAAAAALHAAQREGYHTLLLTTHAQGEAQVVGRLLASILREMATSGGTAAGIPAPLSRPACIVIGGETTVTLGDSPGRGGRNQELALAAVRELDGLEQVALVTLATDGNDGPTDAAGAVVTGETLARAGQHGLDPDASLQHHDAYTFFAALGDLLQPGMTATNVNDLVFLFTF